MRNGPLGIAIMSLGNPFGWPPAPKAWQAGASALADAQRVGATSQREKAYIDALTVFFKGGETTDYRPRATAFPKAMENVAQRYPNDSEAQISRAIVSMLRHRPVIKRSPTSKRRQASSNLCLQGILITPVSRIT